jgi:hypothetical protein
MKACILENLACFVHVPEELVSLFRLFLFQFLIITIFILVFYFINFFIQLILVNSIDLILKFYVTI